MVARGRLLVGFGALALAVGAWVAPVAQGFTWNVKEWKVGPPPVTALAAGESEGAAAALSAGKVVLRGEVLGANKVTIEATVLASVNDKIEQGAANALNPGKLVFEEAKVIEPAECSVNNKKIETNPLSGEIVKVGGVFYDKLTPPVMTPIATVRIEGCALAGNYPLKGEEFGEMSELGGAKPNQPLKFSPAILAAGGGTLTLGVKPAQLTFESKLTLNSGKEFWVE